MEDNCSHVIGGFRSGANGDFVWRGVPITILLLVCCSSSEWNGPKPICCIVIDRSRAEYLCGIRSIERIAPRNQRFMCLVFAPAH